MDDKEDKTREQLIEELYITQQRLAQLEATERTWLHAQLLDSVRESVIATDLEGHITYWGKGAEALYQYTAEEVLGKHITFIAHPEEEELERKRMQHTIETGSWQGQYTQIARDGHTIIAETVISLVKDQHGQPVGFIGIDRDITEQKKAEAIRKKNEDLLKQAQNLAHIGIWEAVLETGETIWSDEFFRICGLEPGSVQPNVTLGFTIIHPDDRERAAAAVEKSQKDGAPYIIEKRIVHPNGDIRWVESRGNILYEDGVQKLVGTFMDITERKQAEQALHESEARATRLLNALPDLVFRLDRNGMYLDYTVEHEALYDRSGESLIGKNIKDNIPPELAQKTLHYIQITLDTQQMQIFEYELPMQGQLRDYEARLIVSGQDEVTAIIRDITGSKIIKQKSLELALEKEKSELLTNFITQSSHEFRTPLSIINTSTHLLKNITIPEVQQRHIDKINAQVKNITSLVNALQLMSKLDSVSELITESFDLHSMLKSIVGSYNPDNIAVTYKFDEDGPQFINANAKYLQQALNLLFENAVRFTEQGGTICLCTQHNDGQVIIKIVDSGVGISESELPHIFKRFYKADKTGKMQGFGLGLSIAQRIIELHHGDIKVQSQPGTGSTFTIIIPQ